MTTKPNAGQLAIDVAQLGLRRIETLGITGKRRDTAALELVIGAAFVSERLAGHDSPEYASLAALAMLVSVRGYSELAAIAERSVKAEEAAPAAAPTGQPIRSSTPFRWERVHQGGRLEQTNRTAVMAMYREVYGISASLAQRTVEELEREAMRVAGTSKAYIGNASNGLTYQCTAEDGAEEARKGSETPRFPRSAFSDEPVAGPAYTAVELTGLKGPISYVRCNESGQLLEAKSCEHAVKCADALNAASQLTSKG